MTGPLTRSEELTYRLCTQSFLSLWCYNNPIGKKGKELCDVLVVCEPDIVVFSVKDIQLGDSNNPTHATRWQRKAVDESIKQIGGAVRWLNSATHVICADGSQGVELPLAAERRIHRVAVACGSDGKLPIFSGLQEDGFAHVFTERDLLQVLDELDTITDFVSYLQAKEEFLASGSSILINGSEADLLGLFIGHERSFPDQPDTLMLDEGIWQAVQQEDWFIAGKKADGESYIWDDLIERLGGESGHRNSDHGLTFSDRERAVRGMAREDRFCRRVLSKALTAFLHDATNGNTRSRLMLSPSQSLYTLIYFRKDEERELRIAELTGRCFVGRKKVSDANDIVLGIGFCQYNPGVGSATDLVLCDFSAMQEKEWQRRAEELEDQLGYFRNSVVRTAPEQEYPDNTANS